MLLETFTLICLAVQAETITGTVVYIADGDTITILQRKTGREVKVRLFGIDCPESNHQPFERDARLATLKLTLTKSAIRVA